jgi:hypothetical protein
MLVASVSTDGLSVRSTDRLILGLIYLKTIDVGRRATSYTEFLCRIIKILHKTESSIPLKVYAAQGFSTGDKS